MQEPTSLVTRAEQLYGAHAAGHLISRERLDQLCREHEALAPCLRQIDYLQRFLADTVLEHEPTVPGYRIERRIGQGGMGTVFAAYHEQLDRLVALKLGPTSHTEDASAHERFLREARALAQVSHRHVVPIYDVMSHAQGSALAMELVVGADLAAVAKALGTAARAGTSPAAALAELLGDRYLDAWPGTVPFLLGVANQIAQALSAVHAAGLVHRDVKPSNIMVRAGERTAVLLDFGVARRRDEVTLGAGFVGTPAFASPEQLAGSTLDERADIYALGRTLHTSLCAALAIDEERDPRRHPRPLHGLSSQLTKDLDAVLQKALEPDPRDRYANAGALARDLAAVRERAPVTARPAGRWRRGARWIMRDRVRLSLAIASALALVFAATLWLQRPRLLAARARERAEAVERALAHAHRLLLDPTRRQQARAAFAAVHELAPDSDEVAIGSVAADVLLRRTGDVERLVAEHPQLRPFAGALESLGDATVDLPAPAPAAPGEVRLATLVRYFRALRTSRASDFAAAAVALRQLRWFEPRARELHYGMLAYAAAHASRAEEHRTLREDADFAIAGLRSLWPDSASAHAWAALALLEFDAAGARAEAALAMRLDPALSSYLGPLSIEALISEGDTERAATELQEALGREPASPALQLVAAQLATARGDDAAAMRACQAALALAPDCVPALARLAEIQWRSDPQSATTHLERLTELAPFLPQPHQNLGRLHYTAKQFERARDHLARAVALDPRDGVSLCMLGECQFHLRDDACESTLAAAARLLGRNARPHYFLSRELHRNGDLDGAIAAAEAALGHIEAGDSSVREESVRNALAQLRRLRGR